MIIQTGMRTDIPAFYSEWFYNRIKEGYVMVRNPYNTTSVTKYSLSPDVVDLIGFCSKNPAPMFEQLDLLKPYGQYWFVTITPYGKDIEPNVPSKEEVMEDFIHLSENVGVNSIGWRYDPILINDKYSVAKHISDFEKMAGTLSGYTDTCIISFIDLYQKVIRNFPEAKTVKKQDRHTLIKEFVSIADTYGMKIKPCGEGREYEIYGTDCSGCMTKETYEKAVGCKLDLPKKKPARQECACFLAGDIGSYNTCSHFCRYCYANYDKRTVLQNQRLHDPDSPLLIGNIMKNDIIHEAKQTSWKDYQLSFDFL